MSQSHKPFVSGNTTAELTIAPIIAGVILGIIFGASSLYLALKVGMTVSASIPVAVLSVTLFKGLAKAFKTRQATILENNIVQTTGSAGESIAFGVAVTMPALLIMGYEMELTRTMLVATLGGLLGVLLMIPLRKALIEKEHGKLIYPEGTACAEVLISGEKGGTTAATVFTGFFLGLIYKFLNVGTKLWKDAPEKLIPGFKGAAISAEVSPELLGVGYIIGPRTASIMMAGGILSSWVLIPIIVLFGGTLKEPLFPATKLISEMGIHEVWKNYVLYIGAGAVAAGGIISLVQSLPTIIRGAKAGLSAIGVGGGNGASRLTKDMPLSVVGIGALGIILTIWLVPAFHMNLLGAALIVLFGFLFVTVSSRLTGEIGSSSNPISGMTVATLLLTCLIFVLLGWVGADHRVTALSIAAIVCVAAANGGTTSQDLKTGYLVGATPFNQQIGLLIGAVTSALVIGFTLNLLNDASTIYTQKNLPSQMVNVSTLTEKQRIPSGYGIQDEKEYHVLRISELKSDGPTAGIPLGKYLVDETGIVRYMVDPGINGSLKTRDDGLPVPKYEAPKARLMSLIIDGILTQKLPWGLVLLGVAIAIVLELCGISALPFAVGVYLPIAASTPIFIGGLVRWATERMSSKPAGGTTESDSSPGVLLSSGLIAGGSIAGICLAISTLAEGWAQKLDMSRINPLAESDGFAVLIFLALGFYLFRVGREKTAY